jgi:hypothetical protein
VFQVFASVVMAAAVVVMVAFVTVEEHLALM